MAYRYKLSQVLKAVPGTKGMKKRLADKLGIDRNSVTSMCKRWPKLDEAMLREHHKNRDTAVEKSIDVVDACLESDDEKTAFAAAKFVLTTQGKHLGYTTKTEISADVNNTGGNVVIFLPDNGRDNAGDKPAIEAN